MLVSVQEVMMRQEELLTSQEVCERLKIHLNTLYRYIDEGKLKAIRMEGLWRIRESDLEAFLSTANKRE